MIRPPLRHLAILAALACAGVVGVARGGEALPTPAPVPKVREVTPDDLRAQLALERRRHRDLTGRLRRVLRGERRLTNLVRNPSPANNRALARILYPHGFWALDKIAAGGDGIGGAPGESDWRETVWNGGGTDPAAPDGNARSCGGGAIAYGIGQACPRSKMAAWAGTTAAYLIAALQIHWMNHYATGRYGSLEAAGAHWSIEGSW